MFAELPGLVMVKTVFYCELGGEFLVVGGSISDLWSLSLHLCAVVLLKGHLFDLDVFGVWSV